MKGRYPAIIPSLAPETNDIALDRLFAPARFFDHPIDVVGAPNLDVREKRAVLAAWASDACAVDSMPSLRQAPCTKRPVTFDDIMEALRLLDAEAGQARSATARTTNHQLDA